ncbi:MAG TPA: UDP-N-acetylmuramate dehydrogenase [Pyrinomonadaceae bacterium]|nr:UDP-N-acetylmuramate dehydrogenase [Pyrinomonadaceae bacterium]
MSGSIEIKENVRLAPLTTLQVGGNARYFVTAETEDAVIEALAFAEDKGLPVFILGGGSNVLISDTGFDGLVINIALTGVSEFAEKDGTRYVTAQAGEDWDGFVAHCVENDLAGVECLSGIPGFVGGTPVQNVGAYGQEVAETIVSVRYYDRQQKELVTLTNADCYFSYRKSIFNSTHRDRYVVLSVTFALRKGGEPKVVYKDLIEHFAERKPSLVEVREAVLNIRRSKSMVIDAGDPNSRSAGSFFKNPIVSRDKLGELQAEMGNIPNFPFGDAVKIPAAWLIERSGLNKGFALGNAGISSNHTLAIINRGGASAGDILLLKEEIQRTVADKFGITLDPEPVFVGF